MSASIDLGHAVEDRPVVLVTAGDPNQTTGGFIYNRRMLDALRGSGRSTVEIVLPAWPFPLGAPVLGLALSRVRPSVVVIDSIALTSSVWLLEWIRRRLEVRLVALMHTLPSALVPGGRRWLTRLFERHLVHHVDRLVAVSPDLRNRLIAMGASPEHSVVILPGRDGLQTVPRSTTAGEAGCRALCVANWTPVKGIDVLIEAMTRAGDAIQFDLVGEERDPAYARQVRALIQRHRLGARIRIHGLLHGEALARQFATADVFVLPSRFEGFGIVCAEAMNAGLPVIATRVGSLPWVVGDGGILVPPGDAAALAATLTRIASDSTLRRCLGRAALERARELPTWHQSCQQFIRLIRDLLSARGRRTG